MNILKKAWRAWTHADADDAIANIERDLKQSAADRAKLSDREKVVRAGEKDVLRRELGGR